MLWIASGTISQVRYKNHRDLPQKKRINVFVKRHTDLIKHLCIALVKHERVFTTMNKAKQLQEYGDLVRFFQIIMLEMPSNAAENTEYVGLTALDLKPL